MHWHHWLGDRKDIRPIKNWCHLIPKGSVLDQAGGENRDGTRELRFTWNWPLKPRYVVRLHESAVCGGGQVKPQDCDNHRDCERGSKMVSEVYLTRLLTTKVRQPPDSRPETMSWQSIMCFRMCLLLLAFLKLNILHFCVCHRRRTFECSQWLCVNPVVLCTL